MSGGLAYVLDETGDFAASLCNRDMVDLDPLDAGDREVVRRLIGRHVELTGSPRGTAILARHEEYFPKFVKVFPHDYKRVLASAAPVQQESSISAQEVPVG
jgi:glutamate synthase domain-containing protein 3